LLPEKVIEGTTPHEERALALGKVGPGASSLHLSPVDEMRGRAPHHDLGRKLESERGENDADARRKALSHVLPFELSAIEKHDPVTELRETKGRARSRGTSARDQNVGVHRWTKVV
jgi:hypothetical protein